MAVAGLQAVELVGMPEAEISLAQVTTYLASAPKSNASYTAIKRAKALVEKTGTVPIPLSLRSARTKLTRELGYGEGYRYAHDGETGWQAMEFMPESLRDQKFLRTRRSRVRKDHPPVRGLDDQERAERLIGLHREQAHAGIFAVRDLRVARVGRDHDSIPGAQQKTIARDVQPQLAAHHDPHFVEGVPLIGDLDSTTDQIFLGLQTFALEHQRHLLAGGEHGGLPSSHEHVYLCDLPLFP